MAGWQSSFTLSSKIHFKTAIDAIDPFVVPFVAGSANQLKQFAKAIPWISICELYQQLNNRCIITWTCLVSIDASAKPNCQAGLSNAQPIAPAHVIDNLPALDRL